VERLKLQGLDVQGFQVEEADLERGGKLGDAHHQRLAAVVESQKPETNFD
jgi:hypothetical protein